MKLISGLHDYSIKINLYQIYVRCKYVPDSEEIILFLHGLACSHDSFRNLFDRDYFPDKTLIVPDLLGFGNSEKPDDFSYSMGDQARLIESLISALPMRKIHIVAHSMGGAVALLFSDKILSDILSFTNIEGNLISEDCGLMSRGIASLTFDQYKNILYEKHVAEFAGHDQLRFAETTSRAVYYSAKSLDDWSDRGELLSKFKQLGCRKSYFYGQENSTMPVLKKLDFAELVMIHHSGHGMMTENPDEFYSELRDFIFSRWK